MEVPGRVGYGILGDESIEFYRTPAKYVEKRQAQYGPVFLGRLLAKPTIFITANSAVNELLNGKKWIGQAGTVSVYFVITRLNKLKGLGPSRNVPFPH